MKDIIFLFLLLLIVVIAHGQPDFYEWNEPTTAQRLHTHSGQTPFPEVRISEDYGPRQLGGSEYVWHGGIDYNSQSGDDDYGDLIASISGGIINADSRMTDDGIKSLIVSDFLDPSINIRFVHVFNNNELTVGSQGVSVGGCIIKYMDGLNDEAWAIIVRNSGVYKAYAPLNSGTVTFDDENGTSRTIDVTRNVAEGEGIVPLGNSGRNSRGRPYPAHLHLEVLTQTRDNTGEIVREGNDEFAKDPCSA